MKGMKEKKKKKRPVRLLLDFVITRFCDNKFEYDDRSETKDGR